MNHGHSNTRQMSEIYIAKDEKEIEEIKELFLKHPDENDMLDKFIKTTRLSFSTWKSKLRCNLPVHEDLEQRI